MKEVSVLYIRFKPGEEYCEPRGIYYSLMPVNLTESMITWLHDKLTPDQWYIYSTLLWYEQIKLEEKSPTLQEIWKIHFETRYTLSDFYNIIKSLENFYIRENSGEVLSLVSFVKEADIIGASSY